MRAASASVTAPTDDGRLEEHRVELTGYCYRMLGSLFDAEDAVQETLLRAWRGWEGFDGRSSPRTWLYRIATNVCLDHLRGRNRRALPTDFGDPSPPVAAALGDPEAGWVGPAPDAAVLPTADPAELALLRDSVRLAFVAALQHLPARQRVVLILRDVLRWHADEVAGLLDSSVPAVNSALQRARATLADRVATADAASTPVLDEEQRDLLARYVRVFERYDIDALVGLLRADAIQSMPPYRMWLRGAADIGRWMVGPGAGCRGSRLLSVSANGGPAFAQYRPDPAGGHLPFAIQFIEVAGGRITRVTSMLDPAIFARFGLPDRLP
ncbi:sigma-70 family RNA polymerase sigma factor [Micromonospora sp. NPDC047527]|uniref:sigma-70 family RNA polymerase sigma factor n=1 Tax=Micromonospora sp. NPDC047527 TaxID=3155144 RepID=UPI0033DCEDEB